MTGSSERNLICNDPCNGAALLHAISFFLPLDCAIDHAEPGANITRKSSKRGVLSCGETSGKPQLALNFAVGLITRHDTTLVSVGGADTDSEGQALGGNSSDNANDTGCRGIAGVGCGLE